MSESDANPSRTTLETVEARLRASVAGSRLVGAARTLARYGRHSWLYRWLTTEPDPDVIVIDLRETYTVGPVIRLLDRGIESGGRAVPSSKTAETGRRVEDRFRRRPLRVLGVATLAAVCVTLATSLVLTQVSPPRLVAQLAVAGLAVLGLRSTRTLDELSETRLWTVLAAAFEPPAPPESDPAGTSDESVDDGQPGIDEGDGGGEGDEGTDGDEDGEGDEGTADQRA